jgi:hypothetical protein
MYVFDVPVLLSHPTLAFISSSSKASSTSSTARVVKHTVHTIAIAATWLKDIQSY